MKIIGTNEKADRTYCYVQIVLTFQIVATEYPILSNDYVAVGRL